MRKVSAYWTFWFAIAAATLIFPRSGSCQRQLLTAGTHFIFSIPEDASHIGSVTNEGKIVLHLLSRADGSGTLNAPNGVKIDITFKANTLREIELPRSLMHDRTEGKKHVGISVKTDVPVNLVLHNILEFAGESTQIYPVEDLGNEYVVASWGLFNDTREDNHAQITITPLTDETNVTITPSVRTLGGIPQDSTFTITLQRGDSYTLKADTSEGRRAGLSGTRIRSTSPISVMTSVTCAYVPIGMQACNTLLDHLLPLDFAGTEFFASPLGDTLREAFLVFTASQKDFIVSLSDGRQITATNGRAVAEIERPLRCTSSTPVMCHLLTPGVTTALISDPSIVAVLPVQHYSDTLLWQTPLLINNGIPFYHNVNVIYEASALASILLDEKPIASQGSSAAIAGTGYAVTQVVLQPGVHSLTSQSPLFAVASGFYSADAYSFIPMGVGSASIRGGTKPLVDDIEVTALANPSTKQLFITLSGADSTLKLTVYDASGKIMIALEGTAAELSAIDTHTLPSGSYVLEVTSGNHRGRARFVISP